MIGPVPAAGLAFVVAVIAVWIVERCAGSIGLVDVPNARSSHAVSRPRGGGLGIIAGTAVALALEWPATDAAVRVIFGASLFVAGVGLIDDRRGLGAWPRLVAQAAAALVVVIARGGFARAPFPAPADLALGPVGHALAVVWIVGVTNFFNFMDGADGLAGGQAVISLGLLGWALAPGDVSTLAWAAAAAAAGFVMRNWSPARIFLGDVGSAWLGFLLAALPFAGPADQRGHLVLLVATSLALFLIDPLVTLTERAVRREPIGASHRDHAYQQFIRRGYSHAPAVSALLAAGLVLAAAGGVAYRHPSLEWAAGALGVAMFAGEWLIARAWRRRRTA